MVNRKTKKTSKEVSKKDILCSLGKVLLLCTFVAISFFGCQFLVVNIMVAFGGHDVLNTPIWMAICSILIYVLAFILVITVPRIITEKWGKHKKAQGTSLRNELGLVDLPTWTDVGLAPVAYIVAIILANGSVSFFDLLFPWFDANEPQDIGFSLYLVGGERTIAFFTTVVVAPIMEELIFRGWLYNKIRVETSTKMPPLLSTVISIFFTSLSFGIIHLQWNVGVGVFALSVVLCILREITGTTYAGILTHMFKNGVAFYFLYVVGLR